MTGRELPTWAGRSRFHYTGSVETGTTITYGSGLTVRITAAHYASLLREFAGRNVAAGTSRDAAPRGGLGVWLEVNLQRHALASYVGAILVAEGYVSRDGSNIQFRQTAGSVSK